MLLEDELFQEAFAEAEARLIETWCGTGAQDIETREAAWRMVKAGRLVRGIVEGWIRAGRDEAVLAAQRALAQERQA
jgi:hypothetical protein